MHLSKTDRLSIVFASQREFSRRLDCVVGMASGMLCRSLYSLSLRRRKRTAVWLGNDVSVFGRDSPSAARSVIVPEYGAGLLVSDLS